MTNCTRREFIQNMSAGILGAGSIGGSKNTKDVSTVQMLGGAITPVESDTINKKKLVVMSDIHFGAKQCLLNGESEEGKKNVNKLIGQIKDQQPKEVILLGDIFDFSLCSLYKTCSNAREFFNQLRNLDGLEVTYIPGNHDHHIWTYIIESEYFIKPLTEGNNPVADYIEKVVTAGPFKTKFLDQFYPGLKVVYPSTIRTCGKHRYYFTHGHLVDDIFTIGSDVEKPETLADLEAFNTWWIEGGWFYLGQAGKLSEKIRNIYDKKSWIAAFRLGATSFLNGIWKKVEGKYFFKEEPVGVRAVEPGYIVNYIVNFVPGELPLPFTFVYGHTHEHKEYKLDVSGAKCTILNTGAWVLEETSKKLEKLPEGIQFPDLLKDKVRYDAEKKLLVFKGVMKEEERKELLNLSPDSSYQEVVKKLFQRSLEDGKDEKNSNGFFVLDEISEKEYDWIGFGK